MVPRGLVPLRDRHRSTADATKLLALVWTGGAIGAPCPCEGPLCKEMVRVPMMLTQRESVSLVRGSIHLLRHAIALGGAEKYAASLPATTHLPCCCCCLVVFCSRVPLRHLPLALSARPVWRKSCCKVPWRPADKAKKSRRHARPERSVPGDGVGWGGVCQTPDHTCPFAPDRTCLPVCPRARCRMLHAARYVLLSGNSVPLKPFVQAADDLVRTITQRHPLLCMMACTVTACLQGSVACLTRA